MLSGNDKSSVEVAHHEETQSLQRTKASDAYIKKLMAEHQQQVANHQKHLANIEEMRNIFNQMHAKLESEIKSKPLLSESYRAVLQSINHFEIQLLKEKHNLAFSLSTAKELKQCVDDVLNDAVSFDAKASKIDQFQANARSAKYSARTKIAVGGVIGALTGSSVMTSLLAVTGIIFIGCSLVVILPLIALALLVGATIGAVVGHNYSLKQNDQRGRQVYKNLNVLCRAQHRLFKHKEKEKEKAVEQHSESVSNLPFLAGIQM